MKKLLKYSSILFLVAIIFASCEKETEGISKVTEFPEFDMTDDEYYFIEVGTGFTEPGIKAFEGGTEVTVQTEGTVDDNTPGVYVLTYTATNSDGYSKSVTRTVIVYDGDITANDLSGDYFGGYYEDADMTVTKIKDGLYQATDVFGYGPPYPIPAKIVDIGSGNLVVLATSSPFGPGLQTPGTYTADKLIYTYGIEGYGYIFSLEWERV